MFTKQHYKAIAEILKNRINKSHKAGCPQYANGIEMVAEDQADYFAEDNSRFDRDKFLKACGL